MARNVEWARLVRRASGLVAMAVLAASALSAGCLPVVVPPTRASLSGAGSSGTRTGGTEGNRSGYAARAGLHPMQLVESLGDREVDAGAGYFAESLERNGDTALTHGPYLELGYYPLRFDSAPWPGRAGVRGMAELLFSDVRYEQRSGFGGSVELAFEKFAFAKGSFAAGGSGGAAAGLAHGEGGIGAFVGAGHRSVDGRSYWIGTAGLSARVPSVLGIICCAVPSRL